MVVIRIGELVDLRILQEFAPELPVDAAALHFFDVAILYMHFDPRIRARVVAGTGEDAVHFD